MRIIFFPVMTHLLQFKAKLLNYWNKVSTRTHSKDNYFLSYFIKKVRINFHVGLDLRIPASLISIWIKSTVFNVWFFNYVGLFPSRLFLRHCNILIAIDTFSLPFYTNFPWSDVQYSRLDCKNQLKTFIVIKCSD